MSKRRDQTLGDSGDSRRRHLEMIQRKSSRPCDEAMKPYYGSSLDTGGDGAGYDE